MGLAPYGSDTFVARMRQVLDTTAPAYDLNLSFFEMQNDPRRNVSKKFIDLFGPPRSRDEPIEQRHRDIARAAQVVLEEAVLNCSLCERPDR